jgi:hypothetical protein
MFKIDLKDPTRCVVSGTGSIAIGENITIVNDYELAIQIGDKIYRTKITPEERLF